MFAVVAYIAVRSASSSDIDTLREQLSDLMTKQLRAKMANRDADTSKLDGRIKELRSKLASLEQAEESRKHEDEMKKLREKELAFRKRCEALKDKRISDLTVNDVQLLNECGASTPRLPSIP